MTRWDAPAPGEREAGDRTWAVVRGAYDERLPAPRKRDWRVLVAVAAGAAVLAAALSPPGLAVWSSLRDAVQTEDHLVALPTRGRVLVNATDGAWVVSRDGSKRFLSGYRDAAWSPHGKFIGAALGNQLVALEPNGKVHWKLARRGLIRGPHWSYEGFRIAYFVGGALRIVNGDGTGDHLLTHDVRPGPLAWEPGTHSLAYVNRTGSIAVANVDRPRSPAHIRTRLSPRQLEWTPDHRLVAVGAKAIGVFSRRGPQLVRIGVAGSISAAASSPDGRQIATVERRRGRSIVAVGRREVFKGAGAISDLLWSPDGRWLLLEWPTADQWLFVRSTGRKLVTVSNIRATYGGDPSLGGWCCP